MIGGLGRAVTELVDPSIGTETGLEMKGKCGTA